MFCLSNVHSAVQSTCGEDGIAAYRAQRSERGDSKSSCDLISAVGLQLGVVGVQGEHVQPVLEELHNKEKPIRWSVCLQQNMFAGQDSKLMPDKVTTMLHTTHVITTIASPSCASHMQRHQPNHMRVLPES